MKIQKYLSGKSQDYNTAIPHPEKGQLAVSYLKEVIDSCL